MQNKREDRVTIRSACMQLDMCSKVILLNTQYIKIVLSLSLGQLVYLSKRHYFQETGKYIYLKMLLHKTNFAKLPIPGKFVPQYLKLSVLVL